MHKQVMSSPFAVVLCSGFASSFGQVLASCELYPRFDEHYHHGVDRPSSVCDNKRKYPDAVRAVVGKMPVEG